VKSAVSLPHLFSFTFFAELGPFDLEKAQKMVMQGIELLVQHTGLYYVLGQDHYIHLAATGELYNRCQLQINGKPFHFLQQGMDGWADIGNVYYGGLTVLITGYMIRLVTQRKAMINMNPRVTFFGAFRVGISCHKCSRKYNFQDQ